MASNVDGPDLLSCQVCFDNFEEAGDHVPRILPCSHTLCEKCVKDLVRNNTLKCPECRKKHRAENKEKSFPQNKYLLAQIQMNKSNSKEKKNETNRCEKHGKELILFCFEQKCQKAICTSCLNVDHKKHEVIEIQEREKEELNKKLNQMKIDLESKVEIISKAKKDIAEKSDSCVNKLRKNKEDFVKCFDNMIEKSGMLRLKSFRQANEEITGLKEEIKRLTEIQENLKVSDDIDFGRRRIDNNKKDHCGTRSFRVPAFLADQVSVDYLSQHFTSGKISVVLPDRDEAKAAERENKQLPQPIASTSQFKGKFVNMNYLYRLRT